MKVAVHLAGRIRRKRVFFYPLSIFQNPVSFEKCFRFLTAVFLLVSLFFSCRTGSVPQETPLPTEAPLPAGTPAAATPATGGAGGIVDEIRFYTERGDPSSLLSALEIIRSRELGATEFGRVMVAVNVTLLRALYPSLQIQTPAQDPPVTHVYSRILREADRGAYAAPQQNSTDYLEWVLPFLAYYPEGRSVSAEHLLSALPDLERAARLNSNSVLADFFSGIVYERTGRPDTAMTKFTAVLEKFPECFPAALGLARIMESQGQRQESVRFLSDLVIQFPDNLQVKRQLALAYYHNGDWSRAEPAVAEILQRDSRDGEFVLMRAHVFVELGQFMQAQSPLDIYAAINPNNKLYLFLRARVQFEAYHNRDAALNYLRSILRNPPASGNETIDNLAAVYMIRLLMESPRPADQSEGRNQLRRLLTGSNTSLEVIGLALDDAIRREVWMEALSYVNRLLEERRSIQDLLKACTVERFLGNYAAALSYARELYERDQNNDEGIIAYATALIDTGRQNEASRLIDARLNTMQGGILKGRYYFLRSMTRSNEELVMGDLRSSLFEDPRNLDALVAMFEIYHRRRDERRAVYYLRQALAIAPDNPRLKLYEAEYAAALRSGF